jgi:ABC-type transport system substrate-binding protein
LVSYDQDDNLALAANENYWQGKPDIDTIICSPA